MENHKIEILMNWLKLIELLKEKEIPIPSEREDLEIIKRVNKIKQLSQIYLGQIITKENISPDLISKDDDLIAIINNVIKEVKGYSLRDSQIYSLIILLEKKKQRKNCSNFNRRRKNNYYKLSNNYNGIKRS